MQCISRLCWCNTEGRAGALTFGTVGRQSSRDQPMYNTNTSHCTERDAYRIRCRRKPSRPTSFGAAAKTIQQKEYGAREAVRRSLVFLWVSCG